MTQISAIRVSGSGPACLFDYVSRLPQLSNLAFRDSPTEQGVLRVLTELKQQLRVLSLPLRLVSKIAHLPFRKSLTDLEIVRSSNADGKSLSALSAFSTVQ